MGPDTPYLDPPPSLLLLLFDLGGRSDFGFGLNVALDINVAGGLAE